MAGSTTRSARYPASGPVLWVQDLAPSASDDGVAAVLALEACGQRVLADALTSAEGRPGTTRGQRPIRVLSRLGSRRIVGAHLGLLARTPVRWLALAARSVTGPAARQAFVQSGPVADRARREGARRVQACADTPAAAVARTAGRLSGVPVTLSSPPRVGAAGGAVLCVCPGVPDGRLEPLVTALGLLADDRPGLHLEVVGDSLADAAVQRSVHERGLEDRVLLRGPLSRLELRTAVAGCTVLVLASGAAGGLDRAGRPTVVLDDPADAAPVDPGVLATTLAVALAALLDAPGRPSTPGPTCRPAGQGAVRGAGRDAGRWRRGGAPTCVPGPGVTQPRDG